MRLPVQQPHRAGPNSSGRQTGCQLQPRLHVMALQLKRVGWPRLFGSRHRRLLFFTHHYSRRQFTVFQCHEGRRLAKQLYQSHHMAISDQIPGLEVTVWVNGKRAIEHDDDAAYDEPCDVEFDSPNGVRVVKYVEAESGVPFGVHLKRSRDFIFRGDQIGWSVSVDGGKSRYRQEITLQTPVRGAEWASEACGHSTGDPISGFTRKLWKFGDLSIGQCV